MFKKSAQDYQGMVGCLALDESDFVDLNKFMKDKKYENTDEDQKKKMIKNTLDELIKQRSNKFKISSK